MSTKSSWVVGKNPMCDIVVDAPDVADRHCKLSKSAQGFLLVALEPSSGTFVNGQRIQGAVAVSHRDLITVGGTARVPWPEARDNEARSADGFDFRGTSAIIGRDAACDWVLESPAVSRRHLRIQRTNGGWLVEDLGSANGTFVNDYRIDQPSKVQIGDTIRLGTLPLEMTSTGLRRVARELAGLVIEVKQLGFDVPARRLLDDISLIILPGEFVGLMGPSGAGKTTLMSAMNGYTIPTRGQVLINGTDLYANFEEFSTVLGYVPQDDIMHRELTVGQALYYTARLRLPAEMTDAQIRERIGFAVSKLGLAGTTDTLIGSPERKGISGGQRKRVNLAMELLTDPAILFLDEPTSGLSSEDTFRVMTLLRQLADSGKSILLTIHQPSPEVYKLLDNLILVSRDSQGTDGGRLVYYGPAYPDAPAFFNPQLQQNPSRELTADDIFRGLEKQPTEVWRNRYEKSSYRQQFEVERRDRQAVPPVDQRESGGQASLFHQTLILARRCFRIKMSDRWNTAILLAQAPIIAAIIILVFGEQSRQRATLENWSQTSNATAMSLFLTGLSALWFGCSNSVREIVGEWAIYRRERMVNLKIPAYILSKFCIGAVLCALQCIILVGMARLGCGLRAPLVPFFLLMILIACTGLAIGLLISAIARTSEVAIGLLPIALIPMVVLGGAMLPIEKMQAPIRFLALCLPVRSGFEALLLQESASRPLGPSAVSGTLSLDSQSDDPDRVDIADAYFPKNRRLGVATSVAMLAAMLGALVSAIFVALRLRDIH
jgi:ABC transport system ATP-binding/permease protein